MAKKNRWIPFCLMPGAWGLSGDLYDEYEARYYFTGEELERKLVDIRWKDEPRILASKHLNLDWKFGKIDEYEHDVKMLEVIGLIDQKSRLDVDLKHGKLSGYEHEKSLAEISTEENSLEREKALLAVEFKHNKITKNAFDKHMATIDGKPWIGIIDQGFEPEQGVNGVYFEFDWNSFWIEYLHLNGYTGTIEEDIVQQWFQDVCIAVAEESGVLTDDMANMLVPVSNRNLAQARRHDRFGNRRHTQDGGTFYS